MRVLALLVGMPFAVAGAGASCVGSDPAPPSGRDGDPAVNDATTTRPDDGDAAPADAAVSTKPCADGKPHDFCDDFEDKARLDDGWTIAEVAGAGRLELVTAPDAVGMAMRTALGGSDGGATAHTARLVRETPFAAKPDGTMPKVIVGFDLFVEAGEVNNRGAAIVGVKLGETETGEHDGIGVYLDRDENDPMRFLVRLIELHHVDGGVLYPGALTDVTIPGKKWTHVELVIGERAPGAAGAMVLSVGDENYGYGFASATRTSTLRIDIGHAVGSVVSGTWLSYVDNVTMDWR